MRTHEVSVFHLLSSVVLLLAISSVFCDDELNPDVAEEELLEQEGGKSHLLDNRSLHKKQKAIRPPDCTKQEQIGMPNECEKYFMCEGDRMPVHPVFCEVNKRFHHQLRRCRKISQEQCEESMCKETSDKFPDPYSKENYLTCLNMYPEVKQCPKGEIYDPEKQTCTSGSPLVGLKTSSEEDHHSGEWKTKLKAKGRSLKKNKH